MSSIVSIASIARHAQFAARRGQPRSANPYPPLDPAHTIWADCHAAAAACAGCDRGVCTCCACNTACNPTSGLAPGLAHVVRRIARDTEPAAPTAAEPAAAQPQEARHA